MTATTSTDSVSSRNALGLMTSRFLDAYLTIVPKAKLGPTQCIEEYQLMSEAGKLSSSTTEGERLPSLSKFNSVRTGSTSSTSNGLTPPTGQTVTPNGSNILQPNIAGTDEYSQFQFFDPVQNTYGGQTDKYDFNYLGTNNPMGNVEATQAQQQASVQQQEQTGVLMGMQMQSASGAAAITSQFQSDVATFPRDGATGMQMAFGALPEDMFVKNSADLEMQQAQQDMARWA